MSRQTSSYVFQECFIDEVFFVLSQGESGGAFKAFKGFSLTPNTGTASFSGFGNGAGFKPLSSLTNGSVAPVAPSFAGFNVPTSAKTNSGKFFTFNGKSRVQNKHFVLGQI